MTKPDKILSIFQLILAPWVFGPPETPHPGRGKLFLVIFATPVLAQLSHFWGKNRAPVRPNFQRWTGFDLLIILGVKFWWFSFFWNLSSPSGSGVSPIWRLIRNWRHLRTQFLPNLQMGLTPLPEGLKRFQKKGKSSEFNPQNYEQVKSSPSLKVWSQKSVKSPSSSPVWKILKCWLFFPNL